MKYAPWLLIVVAFILWLPLLIKRVTQRVICRAQHADPLHLQFAHSSVIFLFSVLAILLGLWTYQFNDVFPPFPSNQINERISLLQSDRRYGHPPKALGIESLCVSEEHTWSREAYSWDNDISITIDSEIHSLFFDTNQAPYFFLELGLFSVDDNPDFTITSSTHDNDNVTLNLISNIDAPSPGSWCYWNRFERAADAEKGVVILRVSPHTDSHTQRIYIQYSYTESPETPRHASFYIDPKNFGMASLANYSCSIQAPDILSTIILVSDSLYRSTSNDYISVISECNNHAAIIRDDNIIEINTSGLLKQPISFIYGIGEI